MAVVIIGNGLAGLATAVKLKVCSPSSDITIIGQGGGNTCMSGHRYKTHGPATTPLFESLVQAGGKPTDGMEYFSNRAPLEIDFWTQLHKHDYGFSGEIRSLTREDRPEWFGSQLGRSRNPSHNAMLERANDVLSWFRAVAQEVGVRQIKGCVTSLERGSRTLRSLNYIGINDRTVTKVMADAFVLAGGNPGGRMFRSTNVKIKYSPQELAVSLGIPLVDLDLFLFHPFGRTKKTLDSYAPVVGCHETDTLAGSIVRFANKDGKFTIVDEEIMAYLEPSGVRRDKMTELTKKLFLRGKGKAQMTLPNGEVVQTEVAHHYSHMGVSTRNGVAVSGMDNLWAVGDAAGTGYWTGHTVRTFGIALTGCLVGAARTVEDIELLPRSQLSKASTFISSKNSVIMSPTDEEETLRSINTNGLLETHFGEDPDAGAKKWTKRLEAMASGPNSRTPIFELSLLTSRACQNKFSL